MKSVNYKFKLIVRFCHLFHWNISEILSNNYKNTFDQQSNFKLTADNKVWGQLYKTSWRFFSELCLFPTDELMKMKL